MSEALQTVELSCPAQLRMLPHVRALVSSISASLGFAEEDVHKIEMAVDEACANVMVHAYRRSRQKDPLCFVCFKFSSDHLIVEVMDRGCGSPEGKPHRGAANLEEYVSKERPSGLGILVMNRFMDEVRFNYPSQGTVVSMTKRLRV